jgi:hypothetical protein
MILHHPKVRRFVIGYAPVAHFVGQQAGSQKENAPPRRQESKPFSLPRNLFSSSLGASASWRRIWTMRNDNLSIPMAQLPNSYKAAMKITNEQKIYVAVLGVAVAALLIDHAYSGPHSASAAPSALSAHTAVQPEPMIPVESPSLNEGMIASKLKAIPPFDLNQICDAFSPSKIWADSVQPQSARPDQFETSHKLSAVLSSHNGGGAIVNGELVRVGETVDGFKLMGVGARSAVFSKGTLRVDLNLGN